MDKHIRIHFIFLFISLFSINYFKAMEIISPAQEVKEQIEKIAVVKSKSQKKRKARKKNKLKSQKSVIDADEAERQALREASKLENIRELLNSKGDLVQYIRNLQNSANLLVLQQWLIEELRSIYFHSKNLIEYDDFYACISIRDDGQCLCGHDKDEMGPTRILLTSKGREAAQLLILPMIMQENFWDNSKKVNEFFYRSNQLLNDENEEVAAVARYVKKSISFKWFVEKLKRVYGSFLSALSNMRLKNPDGLRQMEELLWIDGVRNIIARWLIENGILKVEKILVKDVMYITEEFCNLKEKLDAVLEDDSFFSKKDTGQILHDHINEIIDFYGYLEKEHAQAYLTIVTELYDLMKTHGFEDGICNRAFVTPSRLLKVLPKTLDIPLIDSKFKDLSIKNDQNFDFVPESVKNTKSNVSPQVIKKKKRHKRHNKKNPSNDNKLNDNEAKKLIVDNQTNVSSVDEPIYNAETVELIKPIQYAERVLKWLYGEYPDEQDFDSIFYHTYCPLADYFIKKYGYKQLEENRTNPDKTDTAYYIAARFKYKNGEVVDKILKIAIGEDGLCYHRGPIEIDSVQAIYEKFGNSINNYDFPAINKELSCERKKIHIDEQCPFAEIYKDLEYIENGHCIELFDSTYDMTVILFKL